MQLKIDTHYRHLYDPKFQVLVWVLYFVYIFIQPFILPVSVTKNFLDRPISFWLNFSLGVSSRIRGPNKSLGIPNFFCYFTKFSGPSKVNTFQSLVCLSCRAFFRALDFFNHTYLGIHTIFKLT